MWELALISAQYQRKPGSHYEAIYMQIRLVPKRTSLKKASDRDGTTLMTCFEWCSEVLNHVQRC